MTDLIKISNSIKYADILENMHLTNFCQSSYYTKFYFESKMYLITINDVIYLNTNNHFWLIYNPTCIDDLIKYKVDFFNYKNAIVGFYNDISFNCIQICNENERFN